jgi:uncharacterized membrane protein YGL010W
MRLPFLSPRRPKAVRDPHGFAATEFVPSRQGLNLSALRPAAALLVDYARFHRDRRNIVCHFVGVPMAVFGLGVLLGRLQVPGGNLALVSWGAYTVWLLTRGKPTVALLTSALTAGLFALAQRPAMSDDWLLYGAAAMTAGWLVQRAGHYFEGRSPGFVDDMAAQPTAPMFIVTELLMAMGLQRQTRVEIELGAGSTHLRDLRLPPSA